MNNVNSNLSDEELRNMVITKASDKHKDSYKNELNNIPEEEMEYYEDDYPDNNQEDEYEDNTVSQDSVYDDYHQKSNTEIEDNSYNENNDESSNNNNEDISSLPIDIQNKIKTYDEIFSPFKAGKQTIEIKNADECRQLMQKGVDYARKMQGINKKQKLLRLLEEYDISDPNKLSYAIDIINGDKEALSKLFNEKEIDPLDITPSESTYKTKDYSKSDEQIRLEQIVEDIKDRGGTDFLSELYSQIQNCTYTNQRFGQNPEMLEILYEYKLSGIYDQIVEEMNREKLFSRVHPSLSFIDHFNQVGDKLSTQYKQQVQSNNQYNSPYTPAVPVQQMQQSLRKPITITESKVRTSRQLANKAREVAPLRNNNAQLDEEYEYVPTDEELRYEIAKAFGRR